MPVPVSQQRRARTHSSPARPARSPDYAYGHVRQRQSCGLPARSGTRTCAPPLGPHRRPGSFLGARRLPSVAQRLCDMDAPDRIRSGQIGDGARDPQHPGIATRAHPHRFGGLRQQLAARFVGGGGAVAIDALWCGARNGRVRVSRPPSSVPATLATIETSSASAASSDGRMPGRQLAISDLPAPGGPTISRFDTATPRGSNFSRQTAPVWPVHRTTRSAWLSNRMGPT